MIGIRFSRLVVVAAAGRDRRGNLLWFCQCDCGTETTAAGRHLRNGHTRSCGCLSREAVAERSRSHGLTGTRLYKVWRNMLDRCGNPNANGFPDYGGRGITVCDEWRKFEPFAEWSFSNGYADDLSIDRVDNDRGYSPGNCRWATALQQARNKRPARTQKLTDAQVDAILGDPRSHSIIATEYSISPQHISGIKSGKRRASQTVQSTSREGER